MNCRYLDRAIAGRHARLTGKLDGTVKVSAFMIDVIPEDIPVATVFTGAKKSIRNTPALVQQMTSEDDLSADNVVVADPKSCDTFVVGLTSTTPNIAWLTVNLAGDVTAGVESSADLAEVVTAGVAHSSDLAEVVTAGVAHSADPEVVLPMVLMVLTAHGCSW